MSFAEIKEQKRANKAEAQRKAAAENEDEFQKVGNQYMVAAGDYQTATNDRDATKESKIENQQSKGNNRLTFARG